MAKKSVRSLTESLALKRKEHRWNKVVTALAAVVVFCTTYALILPAITMEREPLCGMEEHVHTDECYQVPMELSCSCQLEAMAGTAPVVVHTHNEYCYDAQGNLVCALPEVQAHQHDDSCYTLVPAEDGHFHNDSCYTERQELTCGLAESEGHTHGPDCYADTLVCAIPENHVHGDGCYEDVLTCTDESEGHVHGATCYEQRLTCTTPENHVHGADCYKAAVVCGLEESAGHTHGPECYTTVRDLTCTEPEGQYDKVLTCTRQEIIVHTHSAACYNEAGELICPLQQVYEHVHGPECWTPVPGAEAVPVCGMEEHTHTDECFSDEFADVETAEDWEATLPKELSGKWAEDVLAVAYSQLGYQESSLNVIFDENGDPHGYTRYGAFMGRPYDDWCAHFVDFVHHYAGLAHRRLPPVPRLFPVV